MKSKFYKCAIFSYYISKELKWFKFLGFKLSFKHINDYEFKTENPKGFLMGWWLITTKEN